jgi:cell wall-associated NlpC family hydrolase
MAASQQRQDRLLLRPKRRIARRYAPDIGKRLRCRQPDCKHCLMACAGVISCSAEWRRRKPAIGIRSGCQTRTAFIPGDVSLKCPGHATGIPSVTAPRIIAVLAILLVLGGCGTAPHREALTRGPAITGRQASPRALKKGSEVVMYAMGLLGVGYRFGGSNPSSGLDCSGMVSYIYRKAVDIDLPHNARAIARLGHKINVSQMIPGDLVFFNTLHRPFSHVGIYIGKGEFIHAPSSNGKIEITRLDNPYFARRLEAARTFFY